MHARLVWVLVGFLLALGASDAGAQDITPATKISPDLAELAVPRAPAAAVSAGGLVELPLTVSGDLVTVDAVAAGDPAALQAELLALGAQDLAVAGRIVSARIPIVAIPLLDGIASLQFVRPSLRVTNVGMVTSQGDHVLRADLARAAFGVDGTGVLIGVLSDSYNCRGGAAADMATGDLPAVVTVIQESPCTAGLNSDEGRAMLQIVHDVAPGASLAFATAENGQANFAANIRALRNAGAKVIVDDVIYFAEPMFQDGVIAQAVDDVVSTGTAYFSSAGNQARKAYEHPFVPSGFLPAGSFGSAAFRGGAPHDFGGTTVQKITTPFGGTFRIVLQWDSPFFSVSGAPGTQNDLDLYILGSNGAGGFFVISTTGVTNNLVSRDAVELSGTLSCNGAAVCTGYIMIVHAAGVAPGRLKYVMYTTGPASTLTPALNAGTIYGHANARGAMAVGAASYRTPTTIEPFSSAGTTPVLFDTAGNLLSPIDARAFKPEIVAPDGADTTFFSTSDPDNTGFPNFFGTSAAAPHAAAVAALLKQAIPTQTPADIRSVVESTAQNMGAAGFDTTTGFGMIHADSALTALHTLTITAGPTATPNPTIPGSGVSLNVDVLDSFGHLVIYAWTSTCTGAIGSGAFSNAALKNPTWTAPANGTGATQTCTLKATVTDGHALSKSGTVAETVLSVPKIVALAPASAAVGATVTITGTGMTGSTTVTFAGAAPVAATAVTATSVQAVVPAGALSGPVGVTNAAGTGTSTASFKVLPRITGFAPSSVVAGGGVPVTVNGTNLKVGATTPTVKVGVFVIPALSITSSATQLTFPVPLGAVTGKISVTTVDGTATSATDLTVIHPPKPMSFVPAMATVGTPVTINGTNLAGVSQVLFSANVSAVPILVTATSVKVEVPVGAVTGPVSVTNPAGTGTTTAIFKVLPRIGGFSPASVVAGGGTPVTITGTNLKIGATTPVVKVGTAVIPAASVTSSDPTQIVFTVPSGPVTGKISVTTTDGTATSATDLLVIYPPKPTAIAPASGIVGTIVTISGTNLTAASQVTFTGPVAVTATAVTATSLKAVVPAGATTGPVSVTNPAGTASTTAVFKVLPRITGFTPPSVVAGSATVVTVNGNNLQVGGTTPVVKVGAAVIPAVAITSSPTQLTFTVPTGPLTGKISVTTVDGTAMSATDLLVLYPPKPTTVTPAAATVGTQVTIAGTNLAGATLVLFQGLIPATPTAVTATSLKVVVPDGATTGVVNVTNPAGNGNTTTIFKLLPKIASFTPDHGTAGSGDVITVSGTNLQAATGSPVVKIGAFVVPPGNVVGSSLTAIQFRIPLGAVTGKISVTTIDGTATSATNLTVVQPPRVTSFVPAAAVVGTTITINGTNLTGTTSVTFGGMQSATPTMVTATSMKVVVPVGAVTGTVILFNPIANVTSPMEFKLLPKITGFTPVSGGVGAQVTVTGSNLIKTLGVNPVVKVGAVAAAVVSADSGQVVFTIPAGAVSGKITITTADGTASSATNLTITP